MSIGICPECKRHIATTKSKGRLFTHKTAGGRRAREECKGSGQYPMRAAGDGR